MSNKILVYSIIIFALIGLILFSSVIAENQEIQIVSPDFHSPVAYLKGENATITVTGIRPDENITIILDNPTNHVEINSYSLVEKNNVFELTFTIPHNISNGVYDLSLKTQSQETISPRSVIVFDHWPSKIRLTHLTDIHIGLTSGSGRPATSYMMGGIITALMFNSTVIVASGDNVDTGAMANQYKDFMSIAESSSTPMFIIPGNHERSGDSTLKNWFLNLGENYYYQRWGPYLFVGLDTGAEGIISSDQVKFFKEVLENNSDAKIKIVFFHHPIFRTKLYTKVNLDPNNTASYLDMLYASWASKPELASQMLYLIDKYNVTLVLSGHVHADGAVLFNNKTWFITTTATGGPVREGDYRGFRVIDVYLNGSVNVLEKPGTELFSGYSSFNGENIEPYFYQNDNVYAYVIYTHNFNEISLLNRSWAIISFRIPSNFVNQNSTIHVMGNVNATEKKIEKGAYYSIVKTNITISPNMIAKIIVANTNDTSPPTVTVYRIKPENPIKGKDRVEITLKITDDAWGVEKVILQYKTPSGKMGNITAFQFGGNYYKARLPVLDYSYVEYRIIATDISGKQTLTEWGKISYKQPTQTTTTKTTQEITKTTTTSEETMTATTTESETTATKETVTKTTSTTTITTQTTTTTMTTPETTTTTTTTTETTTTQKTTETLEESKKPERKGIGIETILMVITVIILVAIVAGVLARKR